MSDSEQFVLFDIPSRAPRSAWSLNPWKTRFLLNYKGLPYTTQWVEYPDIEPTLKDHVPANSEGFKYTSPTVKFPDGTYIMDSRAIVNRIEKDHPSPSLHLSDPHLAKLESIMSKIMPELAGIYQPLVPKRLLNQASQPYWYKTREAKFQMSLDELERTRGGDVAYKGAKPYLDEVSKMLKDDPSGPFFMGKTVSYADFVWAGFLIFMKRIGDDIISNILQAAEDAKVHEELLEGVTEWSARSDR